MKNQFNQNNFRKNIALRKIPISKKEQDVDILTQEGRDKIKIIELTSAIDKWEQEVLFGENGFYSFTGREVEKKENEYIEELSRFINKKIYQTVFSNDEYKSKVIQIKDEKINAVKTQMDLYVQEQLDEWEISTYEDAVSTSIQKAVLYKKDPVIVEKSKQNGLKILEIIAEKEDWNKKLHSYRKKQFLSDFYTSVLKAFINDMDIEAYRFFKRYQNFINSSDKEKLEKQVNDMRINIIAVNWAKEVFSYNLSDVEFQKELNGIEDKEIKSSAKEFYFDLKKSRKKNKIFEEKENNENNWKEIIEYAQKDIDSAVLYIDYNSKKESIISKQKYLEQIRTKGSVKTDIDKFVNFFQDAFSDFQTFKNKDISDYRGYLSLEDFEFFEKLQKYRDDEFLQCSFDCNYFLEKLDIKEKYEAIKIYFISIDEYKAKKKSDIEIRQKIIEIICERYKKNERS